ncbi:methylamine utilization protein [Aquipseudomonas alcaligenes]|uniref:methylamine utilization protein n=1 Tax=Aquipseudomonas alcaligenes TaxID=43263 RepID=UPI00374A44EC
MQLRVPALAVVFGCIAMPLAAASLTAELVDAQGQPLANAVLSLKGAAAPAQPAPGIMDQREKQFMPTVLAVRSGTAVKFPNSDNIRHHVYSFSPPKRFELRLYKGTPSDPVLFDKPGVVVLGCNIHDWMVGYIYVTDDPWFAVSDAQGRLLIDNLPAGSYEVSLWHLQLANMLPQAAGSLQVPAQGLTQRFPMAVTGAAAAPAAPQSGGFGDAFRKATREVQP